MVGIILPLGLAAHYRARKWWIREANARPAPVVAQARAPSQLPPVRSVAEAAPAWNAVSVVGRRVRLERAIVRARVGADALWVGPSASERLLVVLDRHATDGGPRAAGGELRVGSAVSVTGTLAQLPGDPVSWAARWAPTDADVRMLERAGVYVASAEARAAPR